MESVTQNDKKPIMMPKLNREQKFNQDFVRHIKSHKCLYDINSLEYRQRNLYDKAWEDVSKKCGESIPACRRRWRNLKTSTCRYIKQLQNSKIGDSNHKEYYLYADMDFVIPFLKSKPESDESFLHDTNKQSQGTPKAEKRIKEEGSDRKTRMKHAKYQEYELVAGDEGDYILQRPSSVSSLDQDVTNVIEIERDQELLEVEGESGEELPQIVQVQEKIESKHPTTFTLAEVSHETPMPQPQLTTDELFLKSLLPDITTMTTEQKRKFKIRVLTLIDEILS